MFAKGKGMVIIKGKGGQIWRKKKTWLGGDHTLQYTYDVS